MIHHLPIKGLNRDFPYGPPLGSALRSVAAILGMRRQQNKSFVAFRASRPALLRPGEVRIVVFLISKALTA